MIANYLIGYGSVTKVLFVCVCVLPSLLGCCVFPNDCQKTDSVVVSGSRCNNKLIIMSGTAVEVRHPRLDGVYEGRC